HFWAWVLESLCRAGATCWLALSNTTFWSLIGGCCCPAWRPSPYFLPIISWQIISIRGYNQCPKKLEKARPTNRLMKRAFLWEFFFTPESLCPRSHSFMGTKGG